MNCFESKTHSLLLTLLEMAAILRKPERSLFSPNGFILYRISLWVSCLTLIVATLLYIIGEGENKLMAMVNGSSSLEFFICSLVLISKNEDIEKMLRASTKVFYQLDPNVENRRKMELVDKKSLLFVRSLGLLMYMNVMSAAIKGLMMSWLSGQANYPFDMSCLGLPTVPCWFVQIFSASQAILYICCYFSILKLVIYQLWGYVHVLSELIRDRPVSASEKDDRDVLKLYCDLAHFAVSFSNIFGTTAFIDMTFTSARCCFLSYSVIMGISEKNWTNAAVSFVAFVSSIVLPYIVCSCGEDMDEMNNQIRNGFLESEWYECSPPSRKRLLPILTLNTVPIRFQYRQYMHFNMEMLMLVLRSTYSLTTALANFM